MSITKDIASADKVLEKMIVGTEKALAREYAKALKSIRSELADAYAKHSSGKALTYADMAKYGRLEALQKSIQVEINNITRTAHNITLAEQKNLYAQSFYRTAFAIEKNVQAKLGYGLLNSNTIKRAIENPLTHIAERGVRQNILVKVNRTITQGLIKGESFQKMATGIKVVMNEGANSSIRVARTEGHRAQQAGRLDSGAHAEKVGVKMIKVWDAALDTVTRDAHAELDGVKVAMDEDFVSSNGGKGPAPGQMGEASDDINCRCSLRYEIEGFAPEFRRTREDGVISYKTYDEYAKDKGWPIRK